MNRRALVLLAACFLWGAIPALCQSRKTAKAIPAATASDIECSGFFSPTRIPRHLVLANGPDNDFFDRLHAFAPGDSVYLRAYTRTGPRVGSEWRIVRPAAESAAQAWSRPGLGPLYDFDYVRRYRGQSADMRSMGAPYQDVGRLKVVRAVRNGFVAQVELACRALNPGDLAIPYSPRPIPTYLPAPLDRFGRSDGAKGVIAALPANRRVAGEGDIAYINLGRMNNVRPGDRFRVIRNHRTNSPLMSPPQLPAETVGELVVLWTQEKSSVGIVVSEYRGVDVGDLVEGEKR